MITAVIIKIGCAAISIKIRVINQTKVFGWIVVCDCGIAFDYAKWTIFGVGCL